MGTGPDSSRELRSGEKTEVDGLLRAAFGGGAEVELVHALRADGAMATEMVKPWQGRIAAYAALSRMVQPAGWLCLAPVAVWPAFQRGACAPQEQPKGHWQIGRRLVSEIAALAFVQTGAPIVVLGQPEFYEKCGFSKTRARNLRSPYPIEYTLLAAPGSAVPKAELIYPPAFAETGG